MAITYNPITSSPTYTVSTSGTSNGVSGAYIVSNGSGYNTWATTSVTGQTDLKPASLEVHGNAEFKGELTIQGKSLKESLEKIEARLAILHPNEELEEKWDQLRGLRQMYMELEAEIIEKEKMWSILKK